MKTLVAFIIFTFSLNGMAAQLINTNDEERKLGTMLTLEMAANGNMLNNGAFSIILSATESLGDRETFTCRLDFFEKDTAFGLATMENLRAVLNDPKAIITCRRPKNGHHTNLSFVTINFTSPRVGETFKITYRK